MIAPRLYRRSLRRALQWRLVALWLLGALVPTALALAPVLGFLSGLMDRSVRARELVARLDSATVADLLRKLSDAGPALRTGVHAGVFATLLIGPALAGAALEVARSDETPRMRALLAAAGEHYGRLVRLVLVAVIPLGIAGGLSAAAFRAAESVGERALTEAQAALGERLAVAASVALFFVAQLTLDAGRAWFAAQPDRRSAFLAWWSGVRLIVREPVRAAGLGLVTLGAGGGSAAAVMLLRLRVPQTGPVGVVLAALLAELAAACIGWHRVARLVGFTELARRDLADRERRAESPAGPGLPDAPRLELVEAADPPRPTPDPEPPPPAPPPPGPAPEPPGPREGSLSERSGSGT